MKETIIALVSIFITASAFSQNRDFVPDKETAVKIAEAIWLPIYGERVLDKKPYNAELLGDSVWHVHGTLPFSSPFEINSQGDTIAIHVVHGGVPNVFIRKSNGLIIKVNHSR